MTKKAYLIQGDYNSIILKLKLNLAYCKTKSYNPSLHHFPFPCNSARAVLNRILKSRAKDILFPCIR